VYTKKFEQRVRELLICRDEIWLDHLEGHLHAVSLLGIRVNDRLFDIHYLAIATYSLDFLEYFARMFVCHRGNELDIYMLGAAANESDTQCLDHVYERSLIMHELSRPA